MSTEDLEDEFNQGLILPPLIVQLRKILEQYPDDTQILKELIQNAEDAGAREVKFMYDRHSYNKDPRFLQHPGLVNFQGPALYAYNDGLFDDGDWKGIRMLSQSVKQDDPNKVGYFGMGFKSVFHITDLPFIVSGDRMGVIDPHQNLFKQTTFSWNFNKKPDVVKARRHQFEPFFGIFDCTETTFKKGHYKGTIFRFPLRNKESPLSEKIYTQERINKLFDCFQEDSHMLLLFLKNLEKIQLYDRDAYQITPKLVFEVKISDDCINNVRERRAAFVNGTKSASWMDDPLVSSYPMTIETSKPSKTGVVKQQFKYLITHYYCGGHVSTLFKRLCQDQELHNSPWVSTAMTLDEKIISEHPGHVFCFLPLPFEEKSLTGLPVHLNGFFALEHNRKYVKWPSMYRTTIRDDLMDKRLLWNQCLLREALPKAYANMLLYAIDKHKDQEIPMPLETIYSAFPSFSKVDRKWEALLTPLFSELFEKAVIYTRAGDTHWVDPKNAVLDTLNPDCKARDVILDILAAANISVADVPHHVVEAVKRCYRYGFNQISHPLVSSTFKEVQYEVSLSWDRKIELLKYFLEDNKYDLIDGLDLLPLANGGFHTFFYNARRADKPIYISTKSHPQSLLPGLEDDFIDPEIDSHLMELLIRGARRGYTQLKLLDDEAIMTQLSRSLPPPWLKAPDMITWDPTSFGHPPVSWLGELWEYLTKQHPVTLKHFEKLPIIPVRVYDNKTDLVPLAHNNSLICKEFDGISLEETVINIMNKLGVTVINELPSYIKAHPLVTRRYTFTPTHIGVLKSLIALSNIYGLPDVLEKLGALSPEEKRCLRLLFSKISPHELKGDYREVLKHMPVFETMKRDQQASEFVSCVQVNLAGSKDLPPIPLSQKLLDVTGTDSQNLATLLDVTQLTVVELLTSVVFPDIESAYYEPDEVNKIMMYVLKHFHGFRETCPHFAGVLKSLAFIPRKDTLVTPDRFYDPDHELLQKLFLTEEQNFPHGIFAESSIVSVLREVGLRGPKELEVEDLLESVSVVQHMVESRNKDINTITAKADAIFDFLTKYHDILDNDLDGKPFYEHLKGIRWVKIQSAKPPLYPTCLPWFPSDLPVPCFQSPTEVTSREYADLVGSVRPVVAIRTSNPVAVCFGWDQPPSIDNIMQHFAKVITSYNGTEKAKYNEIINQIYNILTQTDPSILKAALQKYDIRDWIWNGDGFCSVNQTVFEESFMDLSPFVYSLPSGLENLHEFFESCGVRKSCSLTEVLKLVQSKYNVNRQFSEAEVKRDLHICVSVLNELKTNLTDESLEEIKKELVVPVHTQGRSRLKLVPVGKCSFCDEEWLRQGRDLSDLTDLADEASDEEPLLVHPNVPSSTSEALGVPTLMSRMLEAEELDFSFGQADSLTNRLHTLLSDYTDGFAVPKELVQNADDAGATEILFLYDERHNEDALTCLIDEGMRECQGPALWAYNDACFTDDDFENICKLSGATKEAQTDKVGRFGLGFNAVYNLTDVPSFVSRHNIVIFDPHTNYLGRSIKNKSKPGIKIDMRKHRRKLRRIGNQFKPYNDIFGCDLRADSQTEIYEGTLFRFPLRTKNQAIRSEICQKHYDDSEMKTLLQMLITNAEALLLFTQNVCKIAVYHLPSHSTGTPRPVEMFRAEKKPISIVRPLLPTVECPPTANKLSDDMKEMIQQSSILKSSTDIMRKIKLGSNIKRLEVPNSSQIIEVECNIKDAATSKLQVSRGNTVRQWLIASSMGLGESLHMSAQVNNLIPCAGVAVPVTKSTEDNTYIPQPILSNNYPRAPNGSVFSYMPLPVQSGLPVHINGAFAITSSRRHLCERNEDDKFDMRALWNETLLKDAVCRTYVNLLQDLTIVSPASEFGYPGIWPNGSHVETNVKQLVETLYTQIVSNDKIKNTVFSDGLQWKDFENVLFLSSELESSTTAFSTTALRVARQCIKQTGNIILYLPDFIRRGFVAAGHEREIVSHTYSIEKFYKDVFLPNIDNVDHIERDTLILQALSMNNELILGFLKGSSCIPVTPKGDTLKCPRELIDPVSDIAVLFSPEDQAFPFGVFQERNTLEVLRKLGLKAERISWADTVKCARAIETVNYQHACKRIPTLLKQIERNIQACESEKDIKQYLALLQDIKFLVPLKQPDYFPFKWKSTKLGEQVLLSPKKLFHPVHKDTVCLVEPILDISTVPNECVSTIDCLSMSAKDPHIDSVLQQLEILADTDNESCLTDNRIYKDVHRICMAVYELLQFRCESEEVRNKVMERLQNKPFLLCHGKFLLPSQVAFEFQQNCSPYLYSVPDNLKKNYEKFLRMMGVRDHFEASDYVLALQDMHSKFGEQPLKRDSLKVALQIVNLLNESMTDVDSSLHDITDQYGTIYIPDANGILRPSMDLCFNEPDVNWVPSAEFTSYSHPHIPFTISKQLGVSTKRQDMLSKHSRGIPFGQKERLTNRIRRILSGYPCDKEILKELLQNADDAGATEIHFVNDPRQHKADRVFDESWKPLQGPALCVFNDKPFSEEDIDGIQRLGEGSKSSDPNKTGQYGVGFNCVYHLTDAPSFLTSGVGETLCVFDPHGKYVPGATTEEPGRRYDDVQGLRKIFTDVFPCYLEDKYPINQGTMFRFPLRTPEMAEVSELSNKAVSTEDINVLFSKFRSEMFDCLLFVNHVKSITLSEIDKRSGKLVNSYTVCAELSDEDNQTREEFSKFLSHITSKLKNGEMQMWTIPSKEVTYTLNLADSNGYFEKWLVHQRIGFEEGTEISGSLIDAFKRKELSLLPRGGTAALLERGKTSNEVRPSKAFCFLPLPIKTKLPININGHFALDHEARRNLWSDEDKKGPKSEWNFLLLKNVIAPAYVAILRSVPTHLSTNCMSPNLSFMEAVDQTVPGMETYGSMFPRFLSSDSYWISLVKGVYRHIHNFQEPVLPIVKTSGLPFHFDDADTVTKLDESNQAEVEWMTTMGVGSVKPYFNTLDELEEKDDLSTSSVSSRRRLTSTPKRKSNSERLKEAFIECGVKLVHLPLDIFNCFRDADVAVECLSPEVIVDFFSGYKVAGSTCTLKSIPINLESSPIRNEETFGAILEYCMQNKDYFLVNLHGLPLLLTEDNQIREFDKSDQVYLTSYSNLLPDCGSQFVHNVIAKTALKDVSPNETEVLQTFDIHAFASLLPNVLSEPWYRKESEHAIWIQEEDQLPTPQWIYLVWNFLRSEYERILSTQSEVLNHEEFVKAILKPLEEWCLLPAHMSEQRVTSTPKRPSRSFYNSISETEVKEQYLIPLGLAHTVLDFTQTSVMNYAFRGAVRNLSLPELSSNLIDGGNISSLGKNVSPTSSNANFARIVVGSMEKPITILQALSYAFDAGNLSERLREEDCAMILKYLNDCADSWKDKKECILMLRDLPMFQSIHGNFVAVGGNTAYVLPLDIPQIDLEVWEQDAQVIFLRRNPAIEQVYNVIGCVSLSTTQVYSQFTFQNFGKLSPEGRIKHLEFIRDSKLPQLVDEEREAFTDNLKNLRFLEHEGTFKKASDFYDPYNPVFKAVFAQDKTSVFPPKPFCEFKWLDFMKSVGLQHEVTKEQFVEFATRVAEEASIIPTEGTFNTARTLVIHLFQRPDVAKEGILEALRDIAFIPVAKVNGMLSKMYPTLAQKQNPDKLPYITFADGIPENHEALIWTSRHLLPDWANPFKLNSSEVSWNYDIGNRDLCDFNSYKKCITDLLDLKEEPSVKDVVDNARNVCSNVFSKSAESDDLKAFMKVDVMKMIYKFLSQKTKDDPVALEELQNTNCILVDLGYTFVKPNQVVIELYEEDQIPPYLYKLPTELGEFKNLFLNLGATEHATPEQYAMVLESMYFESRGAKLHPNELKTAFKAVNEMFTALLKHRVKDLAIEMLYLPSAMGKLLPSLDLIFNNHQSYSERINHFSKPFLVDLAECGLQSNTSNFENVIKLLPRRLRPPKLTSAVSENLEEISRSSIVSHGICDKIRHQLNSRAFAMGITRLIKHEHHRAGQRVKKEVLDKIQKKLKKVKVLGVETLITYLSYDNERIRESECQCECFAEKLPDQEEDEMDIWCLYIDNNLSMNEELLVGVAEFVNRITGGLLSHSVHYLQPILSCSPHSIYRILDRLKIRPDHSIDFKQPTLPTPGSFIPIEDHHLLNEDFNNFEPGEYVGYELSDDETGGQTFIYAVIEEKIQLPEDNESKLHFSQKYRINVGDDRKIVEAMQTDLYKFHRVEGFVSREPSMSHVPHGIPSFADSHSPHNYSRDSYSSRASIGESLYEPQTPRTPGRRGQRDSQDFNEVFHTSNKFDDINEQGKKSTKKKRSPNQTKAAERRDNGYDETNGNHIEEEREEYEEVIDDTDGVQQEPEYTSYYDRFMNASNKNGDQVEQEGVNEEVVDEPEPEQTPEERQASAESKIPDPNDETKTAEQLLESISDALEEAWELPQQQRKKVVKRLLLKWHPDKNIGNETLATMVTQHIHSEIERLEAGLPRPDKFDEILRQYNFDPRNPFSGSTTFQKNFYSAYKYHFDQVNQRAKEHKEQRQKYKEYFSKEYSSSRTGEFNFEVPPTFSSSNPQPNQAKRFLKQAQEDLRAADNDYDVKEPSYEWVCFKAHQAAEKALKAAQFSIDAVTSFNHDLSVLAATLEDLELRRLAMKLQQIIGNPSKLYNPDPIDFVIIPHEEYSKEMACDAVMCSTDILERVKEFVELRD